jgi:hypothetical protein
MPTPADDSRRTIKAFNTQDEGDLLDSARSPEHLVTCPAGYGYGAHVALCAEAGARERGAYGAAR